MRTADFEFDLPGDLIALEPVEPRDAARLLVVRGREGTLQDRRVMDLPDLLRPGDALVVNDTRVIAAALAGRRSRGALVASVDVTLLKRVSGDRWRAFARPAKRLKPGDRIEFGAGATMLAADVIARGEAGEVELAFCRSGAELDAALAQVGTMPLPPYIALKRGVRPDDATRYQTMFAAHDGAVAAPTAGLHFTPRLLETLLARGLSRHHVTLHVGAGTFLPVKTETIDAHTMHEEWCEVSEATAEALNQVRAAGGRIVAVGTTVLRTLESAADDTGRIRPFSGETAIFITPGTRVRAVDALMTNFHLPRSTLLMLVCAFSGVEPIRRAYAHAVREGYRFYSYGDACLLLPGG